MKEEIVKIIIAAIKPYHNFEKYDVQELSIDSAVNKIIEIIEHAKD